MKNIWDFNLDELQNSMKEHGQPKFRGKQIFQWLYMAHRKSMFHKQVEDFDQMGNVPKELLGKLKENFTIDLPEVLESQESQLDGVCKFLFRMKDGNAVESVFMPYKYGNSICISSQAGCRMGCKFCASTLAGLSRNLTSGEMLGQIIKAEIITGEPINHIVVMGTGEPFDNYVELSRFLKMANEPEGFNLSMRNITVSTCGIIPKIYDFAKDFLQVNLAISLHSADDELRSEIMPINKKYGVDELVRACRDYVSETSRRITFEYTLIESVNDDYESAKKLAKLLKGLNCHVNLISLNCVDEIGLSETKNNQVKEFQKWLQEEGINVTIRRKLGIDIDGACGQLRYQSFQGKN